MIKKSQAYITSLKTATAFLEPKQKKALMQFNNNFNSGIIPDETELHDVRNAHHGVFILTRQQ